MRIHVLWVVSLLVGCDAGATLTGKLRVPGGDGTELSAARDAAVSMGASDAGRAAVDAAVADAGFAYDSGAAPDAGFAYDSGAVADAGFAYDSGAVADSGVGSGIADSGVRADSGLLPDTGVAPDSGVPAFSIAGVWAAEIVSAQVISSQVAGAQSSRVTTIARAEVTQSGLRGQATVRVCAIVMDPIGRITMIYPQAAVNALAPVQLDFSLGAAAIGARFTTQPGTQLLGWRSNNPANDALPSSASDGRVFDQDGDGNAAVTLETSGLLSAELYIVNRTTMALDGTVETADRIAGLDDTEITQVILGSNNSFVPTGPIVATPDPNASASTFTMVRLGATSNDCASIVAARATLFP